MDGISLENLDHDSLKSMNINQLRRMSVQLGVSGGGKKVEIIERIINVSRSSLLINGMSPMKASPVRPVETSISDNRSDRGEPEEAVTVTNAESEADVTVAAPMQPDSVSSSSSTAVVDGMIETVLDTAKSSSDEAIGLFADGAEELKSVRDISMPAQPSSDECVNSEPAAAEVVDDNTIDPSEALDYESNGNVQHAAAAVTATAGAADGTDEECEREYEELEMDRYADLNENVGQYSAEEDDDAFFTDGAPEKVSYAFQTMHTIEENDCEDEDEEEDGGNADADAVFDKQKVHCGSEYNHEYDHDGHNVHEEHEGHKGNDFWHSAMVHAEETPTVMLRCVFDSMQVSHLAPHPIPSHTFSPINLSTFVPVFARGNNILKI
jgi:hypothetical protein